MGKIIHFLKERLGQGELGTVQETTFKVPTCCSADAHLDSGNFSGGGEFVSN